MWLLLSLVPEPSLAKLSVKVVRVKAKSQCKFSSSFAPQILQPQVRSG